MGNYYCGMMNNTYDRELRHHGIIGQKWGVKNGPPYPIKGSSDRDPTATKMAIKNIKNARTSNLDKWGKDAEHNTLFIYGRSGSGKSTTALQLKKPGDTIINLDHYSQIPNPDENKGVEGLNKKFVSYLNKNDPSWRQIRNATKNNNGKVKLGSKEYYDEIDKFRKAIESYSIQEFAKGNRVIVEGIQIGNGWFNNNLSYYSDKPFIQLTTNPMKSVYRAFKRDSKYEKDKIALFNNYVSSFVPYIADTARINRNINKNVNLHKFAK